MTTEVKRYGGRTYGKSQDSAASRAFDEVFSKPKATNMKWGNASFVKTRVDEENETKKVKIEEPSDPFSFEFDGDRSPKKRKIQPATPRQVVQPAVRYVVPTTTQPAVRIKTDLHDDDDNDLVVKRAPVKTYTKSSRKVKLQNDASQMKMDTFVKPNKKSVEKVTNDSQETTHSSEECNEEPSEEADDGLYIEKDDGSSSVDVKDILETEEEENIFSKRPKSDDANEITVRFRSRYLDPDVYSKFTENTSPKDPVGRLSNSKVVHSNVLKHEAGTTLIVVCSPKVETDIKHTNVETKYFNKADRKTRSQAREDSTQESQPEKDPFEMDEDEPAAETSGNTHQLEQTATVTGTTETVMTTAVEPTVSQPRPTTELPGIETFRHTRSAVTAKKTNSAPVEKTNINTATDDNSPVVVNITFKSGALDKNSVSSAPVDKSNNDSVATNKNNVSSETKVAPPPQRKYHRIFRSRNKGLVESSQETTRSETETSSVEATPENSQTSKETSEPSVEPSVEGSTAEIIVSEASQTSTDSEVVLVGMETGQQEEGRGILYLASFNNRNNIRSSFSSISLFVHQHLYKP